MPQILEKTKSSVVLKLTIQEYEKINNSWIFSDDKIEDYEFVFDKPAKASDLLKTIKYD